MLGCYAKVCKYIITVCSLNGHDFMKHWIEFMFYFYYMWAKIEPKRRYEWLRANGSEGAEGILPERRETPSTIYSWTIRIMCYVKVWKYIISIWQDDIIIIIIKTWSFSWYYLGKTNEIQIKYDQSWLFSWDYLGKTN